jgi:hypothetical protein
VDAEVLEREAELALIRIMNVDNPIHYNVTPYGSNKLQQFDGILHGHLIEPTFIMVMEAKTSIYPKYCDQVLKKAALCISLMCCFAVRRFIPCLEYGIIPRFSSGARGTGTV